MCIRDRGTWIMRSAKLPVLTRIVPADRILAPDSQSTGEQMHRHIPLLPLAALVGVAACSVKEAPKAADSTSAQAAPAASTAAAPNVVTITASEYKFEMPDQ